MDVNLDLKLKDMEKIVTNVTHLDEQVRDIKTDDTIYIDYVIQGMPFKLILSNIGNFLRVYNGKSQTTHIATGFGVCYQHDMVSLMLSWNGGITAIIDIPLNAKVTLYKVKK